MPKQHLSQSIVRLIWTSGWHPPGWLTLKLACEALGVGPRRMIQLAQQLGIRRQKWPGCRAALFHAGDIAAASARRAETSTRRGRRSNSGRRGEGVCPDTAPSP